MTTRYDSVRKEIHALLSQTIENSDMDEGNSSHTSIANTLANDHIWSYCSEIEICDASRTLAEQSLSKKLDPGLPTS